MGPTHVAPTTRARPNSAIPEGANVFFVPYRGRMEAYYLAPSP